MSNIIADCGTYFVNEPIRVCGCFKMCWMMISTRELESSPTASKAALYFRVWWVYC